MLDVKEVVQNSLIWLDEEEVQVTIASKQKAESDSDSGDESSDLAASDDDEKSPHEFYKTVVFEMVKNKVKDLVQPEFANSKEKAMTLIKSSVKTTLIVSGRAGMGFVDSLFDHGMVPPSTISNIVFFFNSNKKMNEMKTKYGTKYAHIVSIDFVVYD